MTSAPVLLASLDGVAPRFVTPERMPHLCAIVRSGAACFTARTVEPPLTRPVHASMLRGVEPGRHGLVDNALAELDTEARSVLAVARSAGRVTASCCNWRQIDTLVEDDAVTYRLLVDGGYDPAEDELTVRLVETVMRSARPDVTFAYLCATDLAGHAHGWGSDAYLAACSQVDAALGRLVAAAGDGASIVVTTDHGGRGQHHVDVVDDVMEVFVAVRSDRVQPGSMWPNASTLDVAPTVADLAGVPPDRSWQGRSLVGRERPMVDHLVDLLRESDRYTYGEGVTMLQHALQTAAMAMRAAELGEADDELVVAALLHDLGHLLGGAGEFGAPGHAEAGAAFLRPWLSEAVTEPIRLHVAAKRHLVGSEPSYAAELSEASLVTLDQQGGPFTAEESAAFVASAHAGRAVQLRRYDDLGKRAGADVGSLDGHRPRIIAALAGR